VLRPCQAVGAPNVPHDIAAEREKEEWLLGATSCCFWSPVNFESALSRSLLILLQLLS